MAVKASATITLSSVTDVAAVMRYYLLQSSTLAFPAQPTTNPPSDSWVATEPSYTTGSTNSLYVVDLTIFSDDTWHYSPVSLSSSYEAAKVAYNKAVNAEHDALAVTEIADTAQSTAETASSIAAVANYKISELNDWIYKFGDGLRIGKTGSQYNTYTKIQVFIYNKTELLLVRSLNIC